MICPNCATPAHSDDNFCLRCGMPLRPVAPPTSAAYSADIATAPTMPNPILPTGRAEYVYGPPIAGTPVTPVYGPPPIAGSPVAEPPRSPWAGPAFGAPPVPPPPSPWAGPAFGAPPVPPPSSAPNPWQPTLTPVAPNRSANRTIGVIVLAGSALLLLLAVLAVVVVGNLVHSAPGSNQDPAVIAAIQANNTAQIAALHSLDAHALDGKMAGKALDDNLAMLNDLQSRALYQDAQLIHIEYGTPQYQGANHAVVTTVEQWSSTLHRRDNNAVTGQEPPATLHETYLLERQNGHWLVVQVDIQVDPQGTPLPVPGGTQN